MEIQDWAQDTGTYEEMGQMTWERQVGKRKGQERERNLGREGRDAFPLWYGESKEMTSTQNFRSPFGTLTSPSNKSFQN